MNDERKEALLLSHAPEDERVVEAGLRRAGGGWPDSFSPLF